MESGTQSLPKPICPGAMEGAEQPTPLPPAESCPVCGHDGTVAHESCQAKLKADEARRSSLPLFDSLGPNAPTFEDWFEKNIAYIREVQEILQHPMDDSPAIMDDQAREAEGHAARMASILAWADSYLDVAEHVRLRKMPPRDPRCWTDLDREKAMAAAVTRERRFRDVVKGLCESIQQRISYAQSRLRAFSNAEQQRING